MQKIAAGEILWPKYLIVREELTWFSGSVCMNSVCSLFECWKVLFNWQRRDKKMQQRISLEMAVMSRTLHVEKPSDNTAALTSRTLWELSCRQPQWSAREGAREGAHSNWAVTENYSVTCRQSRQEAWFHRSSLMCSPDCSFFLKISLASPHHMWGISSLTRGQTHTPCIGSTEC